MVPLLAWGGIAIVGAYMTYREAKRLNGESLEKVREELNPKKIIGF